MLDAVHLKQDAEQRVEQIDRLAESCGGRVGLDGVLGDLDRRAHRWPIPGRAISWGVALDLRDSLTLRWWPQGITTSADHSQDEQYAGRRVVLMTSYSKTWRGGNHGCRLTVLDVTDRSTVRYRHVLLVEARTDRSDPESPVSLRPVRIHAGGVVWHGGYIHVAATGRGLFTFRLEDIVRLPADASDAFGYRYVLPLRYRYTAVTADGQQGMRYSFLSLDRSGEDHQLVAGEYGRRGQTTRFVRYDMDPATGLLLTDPGGASRPRAFDLGGIEQMQGVASVGGRFYVTQSLGRLRRGSLWVGTPGGFTQHSRALPQGPEDLCYWPSYDELWSVSEHPMLRFVFAVKRSNLDRT